MIRKVKVLIPCWIAGESCEVGKELLVDDFDYKTLSRRVRRGKRFIEVVQEDANDPEGEKPKPKPKPKTRRGRPPKAAAKKSGG